MATETGSARGARVVDVVMCGGAADVVGGVVAIIVVGRAVVIGRAVVDC